MGKETTIKCMYCSKEFIQSPGVGQKRKYCSKECRYKATKERYAKKETKVHHASIEEVERVASEVGLSYGKTVAKHFMQQGDLK